MKIDANSDQRRILIWMCVFIGVYQMGSALILTLPLSAQAFGVPASGG